MRNGKNGNGNGHTNSELVLCPGSREAISVQFLDQEDLHRVPQSELDANGGLCSKCRQRINEHVRLPREPETPVSFDTLRHHIQPDSDHVGFEGVEKVETCEFDFDSIDDLLGHVRSKPEDVRADAAVLFSEIMAWVWAKQPVKTATIKFCAFTAGLRPDLIDDRTFLEIGRECGVTKQAVSKAALGFADAFGIHFARCRPSSARINMAANILGRNGDISDIGIRFLDRLETAHSVLSNWRRVEPPEAWSESTRRRVAAKLKPLVSLHEQLVADD